VGVLAAARGVVVAGRLPTQRLLGRPLTDEELAAQDRADATGRPTGGTDTTGRPTGDAPVTPGADPLAGHPDDSADDAATEAAARAAPTSPAPRGAAGPEEHGDGLAPPGYHIYRPSSAVPGSGSGADGQRRESPGPVS
jgi:hypothetical protein